MIRLRGAGVLLCGVVAGFAVGCGNQAERIVSLHPASEGASVVRRSDLAGEDWPRICFFNDSFEYCYANGGYCACSETEVLLDVGAGRVVTMNWSAEPQPGTAIRFYRWSLDIEDVTDETPRIDENTDLTHWSQRGIDVRSARLGPWSAGEQHRLYVDVEDDRGFRSLGIIRFTAVEIPNRPPECGSAVAQPPVLWPPNHRMVAVHIGGVSDPDGDPVAITVNRVTQDEPSLGSDDGDIAMGGDLGLFDGATFAADGMDLGVGRGSEPGGWAVRCPDAVIGPNGTVELRAERSSQGNGRVYTIWFTASDPNGGSCDGSVRVCVPRDQRRRACIDDGQNFNSLGPCQ